MVPNVARIFRPFRRAMDFVYLSYLCGVRPYYRMLAEFLIDFVAFGVDRFLTVIALSDC